MYNAIICRYHEIAIKGNNRSFFEKKMIENLRHMLSELRPLSILRVRGRIWIELKDKSNFTAAELELVRSRLRHAFGLESFSPVIMCAPQLDALRDALRSSIQEPFSRAFEQKDIVSFRIRCRRSDKKFPIDSNAVAVKLAEVVAENYDDEKLLVDLKEADVTIFCEIREEFANIFFEKYPAAGGLPVGSNSPVLALLSGGIDSPVACYMAMKRGCRCDFLTFHSAPYTPPETVEKVKQIATHLNQFQTPGKLFICNLSELQKLIRDKCRAKYRTVLYRRMMFRIAEKIAHSNRRFALLTGESVGQVASQTIVNLNTINNAVDMLVLRPLIGMDKNEAIRIAENIDTFEMSKEQVPDSCTVFAPPSPATRASLDKIADEEARIPEFPELIDQIIAEMEVFV